MDTPVSNDVRAEPTGSPECFIRTLKEILMWVRTFEAIAGLRLALIDFAQWRNTRWLIARDGHMTPAQITAEQR